MLVVNDVEQISSVYTVESISEEVIFAMCFDLSQATSELVLHLEINLLHFIGFATDFDRLGHDASLPLLLQLSL